MEKDIGKITKNDNTDIVVRVDDFGGRPGVTIREFTTSERYTGFTKSGTRIPADKFIEFREMINKISLNDLKSESNNSGQKKIEDSDEEAEDY
ncbi:hypothetical protein COU56_00975 [Candidatus Pacearchaeota archaeon CG10_big_fil_rev_8_21_14_0_10_31_9]|nr:MAG: hypothetical protein AUJ62_01740 [Candidatus Pacearchaeota archaeon CG1_02_32_21]PIN95642.1 MAG: hypothetical protein COU56_00975 [Candidatus Pacearchaeota archaeon CG10_big_fil_rev_8_21_14_0_10_31_9]PIZ83944.1 MAG: hypothetical protein COX97_00080 [Candidatus Pacearchaeota archaeon CG_4_10_14_0_2_um_filter_05_32_18]